MHDVHGVPLPAKVLRPAPAKPEIIDDYLEETGDNELQTYRILHLEKTAHMWNESSASHQKQFPGCDGTLIWDVLAERKVGLCRQMRVRCRKCLFEGKLYKLYTEVDAGHGRKAAGPNLGVQIGLSHSMISNTAFRNILLAANIPAPSHAGMQRSTNKLKLVRSWSSSVKKI